MTVQSPSVRAMAAIVVYFHLLHRSADTAEFGEDAAEFLSGFRRVRPNDEPGQAVAE